jgi:hypothetical protein
MSKRLIGRLTYSAFLLTVVFLLLEIAYRFQVVDFYSNELRALNPTLNNGKENILVFGDSFTADPESYVSLLRVKFPRYNFINCALPGSGIEQHRLFFEARIKEYKPTIVLYQFYVGNDFLDIHHPINWKTLPLWRNAYWWFSEQFIFLQYLNFKMAFLNIPGNDFVDLKEKAFAPFLYNKRTGIYIKGNPSYLENTVRLKEEQLINYSSWKKDFEKLMQNADKRVNLYFLPIPHHAQVSNTYEERMKAMNADLKSPIQEVNYNLLQQIKKDFPDFKVINPLGDFQLAEKSGKQLYFENDPHLTLEGQKVLAALITERLILNTRIAE